MQALEYVEKAIGEIMQLTQRDLLMVQLAMELVASENSDVDMYSAACLPYVLLSNRERIAKATQNGLSVLSEEKLYFSEWSGWVTQAINKAHPDEAQAMIDAENQPFSSYPDAD